jgi:phosphoribosylanthranilate isomerase
VTRTRVKICGITRTQDALAAARAGADAIGLVFHKPAQRYVAVEAAREILRALPPFVTPVALFVDADADEILHTTTALGLRHVQLHGSEEPALLAKLTGRIVLKALRVTRDGLAAELTRWKSVHAIILETAGTPHAGGTGIENDWALIRKMQRAGVFNDAPPIIAAGGLRPENVADVIRVLRPWAVDVSSGVELIRGQKSPELVEKFIQQVQAADASSQI